KTTCAFTPTFASVELHVTNVLFDVFVVTEAFQSSEVPVWKKNPLCATVLLEVFIRQYFRAGKRPAAIVCGCHRSSPSCGLAVTNRLSVVWRIVVVAD